MTGDGTAREPHARAVFALFAVLLFIALFWQLGAPTFWDPDEAHYAQTSRELIRTGDWLAPFYNEQPFFDKPILFHWLQALAMVAFGETTFAARLVPALAALALVGVTAWLGVTLLSADVALVAALMLAASPGLFGLARYAILDTTFTALMFGGAALIVVAALRRRPHLQWYGYVLIALAVLTKGPLALVLCGVTLCLAVTWSPEVRRRLLGLRLVAGVGVVIAIAGPWFVYMWLRFGDAFVNGYILDENLSLYATNRFGTPPSAWFYVRVIAASLIPWTALIAGRLYDDVRATLRRDGSVDAVDVVLWSWTIGVVGFFTLSRFKLDHYVFPAAPTLCLIGGRAWLAARTHPFDPRNAGARIGAWLIGPLTVLLAGTAAYLLVARLKLPSEALVIPPALGIAGALTTLQVSWRSRPMPRAPWVILIAIAVTYAGLLLWVIPALEERKVVPGMARWVATQAAPADRIAAYRLNRWNNDFRFYVDRHVSMIDTPAQARAFFSGAGPFYCAMLEPAYEELVAQGLRLKAVYEVEGMWVTSGRVLWRLQPPLARFVVVTGAP
jgi:4-amino-4-deoxy-L-arabinose transferase-like glycosyltransferase